MYFSIKEKENKTRINSNFGTNKKIQKISNPTTDTNVDDGDGILVE